MARQAGIMPITGTIDELTFYKHPDDGHLVKKKSRVTGERVKSDPNFKQTMLNASEFRTSLRSAQLLRRGFDSLLFPIADGKLSGRMNQEMVKVVHLDALNGLGKRKPYGNALIRLEGFDFNRKFRLREALNADYRIVGDEANKSLSIHIPSFIPSLHVNAPEYVTYFKLVSGVAVIDFEEKHFAHEFWATDRMPRDRESVDAFQFDYSPKIPTGYTLFLTLGILFYGQLEDIPKDATSKRKRRKVKKHDGDGLVAFTGALSIVKVIPGPAKEDFSSEDGSVDDAWEMDGLGIA